MIYTECYYKCRTRRYMPGDQFNILFKKKVEDYYGEHLKKCDRYCGYYVLFLQVGASMFGRYWERTVRRSINIMSGIMYYCSHCRSVFSAVESVDHVFKMMKDMNVDIDGYYNKAREMIDD